MHRHASFCMYPGICDLSKRVSAVCMLSLWSMRDGLRWPVAMACHLCTGKVWIRSICMLSYGEYNTRALRNSHIGLGVFSSFLSSWLRDRKACTCGNRRRSTQRHCAKENHRTAVNADWQHPCSTATVRIHLSQQIRMIARYSYILPVEILHRWPIDRNGTTLHHWRST